MNLRGRVGWTLVVLAMIDSRDAIDEGGDPADLARAVARYEEALAIFREAGDARSIARALHGLAYLAYKQRDLPRALAATQEVLALDWAGNGRSTTTWRTSPTSPGASGGRRRPPGSTARPRPSATLRPAGRAALPGRVRARRGGLAPGARRGGLRRGLGGGANAAPGAGGRRGAGAHRSAELSP